MNINEIYKQYSSIPGNVIGDPEAIQERVNHYTQQLEQTITDSKNRKLQKWQRELALNKIHHVRKELKSWQDVYNDVIEELTNWYNNQLA